MNSYGLYIHIPFCISKCYYCDFNSIVWEGQLAKQYLAALDKEAKLVAAKYKHPVLESIFIGGGTPSCLSGEQIYELLARIKEEFQLKAGLEITIEANPGTVNTKKLELFKEAAINRLSFGIQSFNDQHLQSLGRIHSSQEAINNYYLARELGFENINLDLIFALPGQSLADWLSTLKQAVELKPEHLATYNLEIGAETEFGAQLRAGILEPISEELDLEMYEEAMSLLLTEGYQHYEISNFARPGYNSTHNQLYWRSQPYLALGAGAHFYDGQLRAKNLKSVNSYLECLEEGQLPIADAQQLSLEDKIIEKIIMGLRLRAGLSLSEFAQKFGHRLEDLYAQELAELEKKALIKLDGDKISLSKDGLLLANDVLAKFVL